MQLLFEKIDGLLPVAPVVLYDVLQILHYLFSRRQLHSIHMLLHIIVLLPLYLLLENVLVLGAAEVALTAVVVRTRHIASNTRELLRRHVYRIFLVALRHGSRHQFEI